MNNITNQCRDTKQLNGLVKVMLELALEEIKSQGVNPLIIETYRPQERQNYLYCQGRSIAECTLKGIKQKFAEQYSNLHARKITWTLNSVHKSHKAVDIVPQHKIDGKWTAIWNQNDKQTHIIIKTMQKYGFEAGANWRSNADSPHFQVKGSFGTSFSQKCNTEFVTKAIQLALNKKLNIHLLVDGDWGALTTAAVNMFRKQQGYKLRNGKLGSAALNELLS